MREDVPANLDAVWRSGDFTGVNRPVTRVTIQRPKMKLWSFGLRTTFRRVPAVTSDAKSFNPYPSGINPNKGEPVTNTYADYLFSGPNVPKEFPNVQNVSFSRTVDADAGSATLTFFNQRASSFLNPDGPLPAAHELLDQPGFYSFMRGMSVFSSRWGHTRNEFAQLLAPDNIVRVYQGYGSDLIDDPSLSPADVPPERDSHLVLTGTWHIDDVDLDSEGSVVVRARDMARLLVDHMCFSGVVPNDFYPPSFEPWGDVTVVTKKKKVVDTRKFERLDAPLVGSGNDKWPESAYLGASRHGHKLSHAQDGRSGTYWLSVGNPSPLYRSAYEYVDMRVKAGRPEELRIRTRKTGYKLYVSMQRKNGSWVGGKTMPYHRDGRGRYDEGLPYVRMVNLGSRESHTIKLPKHDDVRLVRVWLGNLPYDQFAGSRYRASIREISLWGTTGARTVKKIVKSGKTPMRVGPTGSNPGMVQDYTDVVKMFCAWAGFFWPSTAVSRHCDGVAVPVGPRQFDGAVLGKGVNGRVWGDFQQTGVAPQVQVLASHFDKKSLMECVNYIRDTIGFLFFVDEYGSVQWRQSNVWELGNWVSGMSENPRRTERILFIDEKETLKSNAVSLTSRNVRENIFVGNLIGGFASIVGGYNPNDTGLRRTAGWTDGDFGSAEESQVMADLIAVRQLFKFRTNKVVIAANPAIQVDDQVRIFDQMTSEGYVHYVKGISSEFDAKSGVWSNTLQTHWLGDNPEGNWTVKRSTLASTTVQQIETLAGGPQWSRKGLSL